MFVEKQDNLAVQWSLFESMQHNDMIIFRVSVVRHVEAAGLLVAASPLHLQHLPLCVVFRPAVTATSNPFHLSPGLGSRLDDVGRIMRRFGATFGADIFATSA